MGEQYLYQKFPFLSQKKKELSEIYFWTDPSFYYLSNAFESDSFAHSSFQE